MTTDDKCQSCGFPLCSPPGVTCGTHDKHSIQGTDDWRPLTEEEAARVPSALRWVRVAVKKEEPVSDKQDPNAQSTWTEWQRYCYRVHQHRLETIPGYKEDLERRSAEFNERVRRMPEYPLNPHHSEDADE